MKEIDFWYSVGSTYSYLTVMRLGQIERDTGVCFNWRPFDVRSIMVEQSNIPFRDKPVKAAYMWRDIGRRAAKYGLPVSVPAPYPLEHFALANRVAVLGMREGWGRDYTVEAFRLWFVEGQPAGSEPNLSESLRRAGQDPARVIPAVAAPDIAGALANETEAAKSAGVFGAPTFVVGEEVFWGDDRLEDALEWARGG